MTPKTIFVKTELALMAPETRAGSRKKKSAV
jgi:hypothetical protein